MKRSTAITPPLQILFAAGNSAKDDLNEIENRGLLIGAVAASIFLSWLTGVIRSDQSLMIDSPAVLQALHGHIWLLEKAANGICASVTLISVSVLFMLLYRRKIMPALFWLSATGGGALLEHLLKNLIKRPRPELIDLVARQSSFAFPSGHAIHSMAVVLAALILFGSNEHRRKFCLAGGSFVGLVGFSRLYLGMHYPSDILAGWALAVTWVCALGAGFNLSPVRSPINTSAL